MPKTFSVPRLEESLEMDAEDAVDAQHPATGCKKDLAGEPESRAPPALLLEFWQADAFLGEASFGRQSSSSASSPELRVLKVLPLGHEPPLRSDGRKLLADATQEATAVVSLRPGKGGGELLNFKLGRAERLPISDHEEKVHAVLWTPGCREAFFALCSNSALVPRHTVDDISPTYIGGCRICIYLHHEH